MKVWAINGHGDEGSWDLELFSTKEKAAEQFHNYIDDFNDMYPDAEWEIEDEYARYDNDNHYDTFWIEEVEVK